MNHKIYFHIPPPTDEQVSFYWDDETGELSGDSVIFARLTVSEAIEDGFIICTDINGTIPAINPLKNKTEFAAIIGVENLPDELKKYYPSKKSKGYKEFSADAFTPTLITY